MVYSHPFSERTRHNFTPEHRNRLGNHNSESALRDCRQGTGFAEFHTGAEIHRGACVLVHRLSYPLGRMQIFVRPAIGNARKAPIQNRHFDPVGRIRRFPVWRPNSSPGAWSRAADVIAYGHPFAQLGITFRSVMRIAYKTPIRNRHSEAPVAPIFPKAISCHFGVEKPSFRTTKLQFWLTIFPIPRFSYSSTSLDYANRWRCQHMESTYHDDRKSCSTRLEITTPSRGYRCTNIADIVTPYGLFPPLQRKNWA
ncbi:hypothetical protein Taro_048961 [Colocasia esculenta]|uniref:Uncharacterized protein n=1 Tax=Colocasia esculenta TaxID=4460 RepID=A0A843X9S2_COLES|nr:hypothetical protein [Colocasia esculenta]